MAAGRMPSGVTTRCDKNARRLMEGDRRTGRRSAQINGGSAITASRQKRRDGNLPSLSVVSLEWSGFRQDELEVAFWFLTSSSFTTCVTLGVAATTFSTMARCDCEPTLPLSVTTPCFTSYLTS